MQPVTPTPQQQQQAIAGASQQLTQPQAPNLDQQVQLQNQSLQGAIQAQMPNENALLKTPPTPLQSQGAISQALGVVGDKSTQGKVGQAIATPAYAGYCLQWVDDQQGNKGARQQTAYADFQQNQAAGNISTKGTPPKGARVYFAPNDTNGGMGHVGISTGNGNFTSATDNGVQTFNIQQWDKYAGQDYIGYSTSDK